MPHDGNALNCREAAAGPDLPALPHHLRLAALQCNFEGGREHTLLLTRKWREFGFNAEQLFHPCAELYTAVYDARQHRELLQDYLAEAKACGLSVIMYLNCHILPPSQEDRRDDWAARDLHGNYLRLYDGTYYRPCYNSGWTDHFLAVVTSLRPLDIAGIFFDGPLAAVCGCPACRERFAATCHRTLDTASPAELAAFSRRTFLEFSRKIYHRVKEVNPAWLSYTNVGLLHGQWSAAEMRDILSGEDMVGTEGGFQFYGRPQETPFFKCSLAAKAVEAVAAGRPGVIFMAGDHKPWSWYLHSPTETRLCYAAALANGAGVWYGLHGATTLLDSPTGAAVREMLAFDHEHHNLYERTVSRAEVALFYSFDTACH
ncbi:MAG: hypothetical protein PHQ27_11220, partial [Victivallales bacterium]|nr:hypothetical protein [Victivallales bacterium]